MNTKVEELYIETPGGKIYVKKWIPEGITFDTSIVLLHDSIGCVDMWRGFPELMSSMLSCCVIAYDRLGYGNSGARYASPSVEFIEEEAAVFVSLIKKSLSLKKNISYVVIVLVVQCLSVLRLTIQIVRL